MKSIGIQVEAGSPAWKAGLRSGMRLLTMNGEPVLDFIDYEYFPPSAGFVAGWRAMSGNT